MRVTTTPSSLRAIQSAGKHLANTRKYALAQLSRSGILMIYAAAGLVVLFLSGVCQAEDAEATEGAPPKFTGKKLTMVTVWLTPGEDSKPLTQDLRIRVLMKNVILHPQDAILKSTAKLSDGVQIALPSSSSHPVLETETRNLRISISGSDGTPWAGKDWMLQATGQLEDDVHCELTPISRGMNVGSACEWFCQPVGHMLDEDKPAQDTDLTKVQVTLIPPTEISATPMHLWLMSGKRILGDLSITREQVLGSTELKLKRRVPESQVEALSLVFGSSGPDGVGASGKAWAQPWNGLGWQAEAIGHDALGTTRFVVIPRSERVPLLHGFLWLCEMPEE